MGRKECRKKERKVKNHQNKRFHNAVIDEYIIIYAHLSYCVRLPHPRQPSLDKPADSINVERKRFQCTTSTHSFMSQEKMMFRCHTKILLYYLPFSITRLLSDFDIPALDAISWKQALCHGSMLKHKAQQTPCCIARLDLWMQPLRIRCRK